jgi:hypothetical protein
VTKTWEQLGRENAEKANERLRQQGEESRQRHANDALREMIDILNSIDSRIARIENLIEGLARV